MQGGDLLKVKWRCESCSRITTPRKEGDQITANCVNEEANTEFKPRRLRLEVKAKIEMFLPSLDGLDGTVAGSDWLCSMWQEGLPSLLMVFRLPPLTDFLLGHWGGVTSSDGEVFDLAFVTDVTYVTGSQLEPVAEAEIWKLLLFKYFHQCRAVVNHQHVHLFIHDRCHQIYIWTHKRVFQKTFPSPAISTGYFRNLSQGNQRGGG